MRVAICDSNGLHAELLADELQALAAECDVEVITQLFPNYASLEDGMGKMSVDLMIVEAEMDGNSGIELVSRLRRGRRTPFDVIFVSADSSLALAAYAAFPIGFLLKPVSRARLRPVFRHAIAGFSTAKPLLCRAPNGERLMIHADDIVYVEVTGTDLVFHCLQGELHATGALSEICTHLPVGDFYRSHRSFVVNLNYVVRSSEYFFTMSTGEHVSIAKNRYAEAKHVLADFAGLTDLGSLHVE